MSFSLWGSRLTGDFSKIAPSWWCSLLTKANLVWKECPEFLVYPLIIQHSYEQCPFIDDLCLFTYLTWWFSVAMLNNQRIVGREVASEVHPAKSTCLKVGYLQLWWSKALLSPSTWPFFSYLLRGIHHFCCDLSQIPEATFHSPAVWAWADFFSRQMWVAAKMGFGPHSSTPFSSWGSKLQLRSVCWTEQNGRNKTNITAVFAATFSEILCIVFLPQISKADVGGQAAQLWCRSLFQRKRAQIWVADLRRWMPRDSAVDKHHF